MCHKSLTSCLIYDISGVENGSEMWTTVACRIHSSLIWVGRHRIIAEDTGTRVPDLTYSTSLIAHRTIEAR